MAEGKKGRPGGEIPANSDLEFEKCRAYSILASVRCVMRISKRNTRKASDSRLRRVEVMLWVLGSHERL